MDEWDAQIDAAWTVLYTRMTERQRALVDANPQARLIYRLGFLDGATHAFGRAQQIARESLT